MSVEQIIQDIRQKARESWSGQEGENRADRVEELIRKFLPNYSEVTGKSELEVLQAIENNRHYSAVNYYQEANFPLLEGEIKVFATLDEIKEIVGDKGFRCPACNAVSTDPYRCDSGVVREGKECDWAAFGLFRTMGKGLRFTIVDKFLDNPRVDEIFMPVALEGEDPA